MMNPKCPCLRCSAHIEFDPEQAGQRVACPHCGEETLLFIVPPITEAPRAQAQVKTEPSLKFEKITVREALLDRTQYSNERTIVNWAVGLTTVGAVIGLLAMLDHSDGIVAIALIGSVLSAWVFWGLAHAIFDMADCALRRYDDNEDEL